jgi:hypothetical protein
MGVGLVPAVYAQHHPDPIKKFPTNDRIFVEEAPPDSENRQWRLELDLNHDAESISWPFFTGFPGQSPKELITWSMLRGLVDSCIDMLEILALGRPSPGLTHSVYQPLLPLLSDLAAILVVDRHWLDESEPRNDPEYVPEAFQPIHAG